MRPTDRIDPRARATSGITRLHRNDDGGWQALAQDDTLAVEEPLEIRLQLANPALPFGTNTAAQHTIAITMRTPGDDFELAVGFLLGEGILRTRDDIEDVAYCLDPDEEQWQNIVTVSVRQDLPFDAPSIQRSFYTTSSCGICGRAALDALSLRGATLPPPGPTVSIDILTTLPARLRKEQTIFESTGGLHAAGLFTSTGDLIDLREDVGRHNALDKLIGAQLQRGTLPLHNAILVLSGRASYELLQKAVTAGIPIIAAVGAPSSLAVEVAQTFNLTLLGFTRPASANIYSGAHRLTPATSSDA